jgi:hypothetical protein
VLHKKEAHPPPTRVGDFDKPLFTSEGPEFYDKAFAHNKEFATGGPYRTKLTEGEESQFRQWVKEKGAPFDPDEKTSDYDMRGFWKEQRGEAMKWKRGSHFPDTYKTPYDTTFSAESKYAKKGTPFKWQGNRLIDTRTGQVVSE